MVLLGCWQPTVAAVTALSLSDCCVDEVAGLRLAPLLPEIPSHLPAVPFPALPCPTLPCALCVGTLTVSWRPPPRASTSPLASCWAVCRASWACARWVGFKSVCVCAVGVCGRFVRYVCVGTRTYVRLGVRCWVIDSLACVSHLCVFKCTSPRRLLVVALTDAPPVPFVCCFPQFLESNGHTFVVTSDKDGAGCKLEKELEDADVVISQPFYPFYLTEVPGCYHPSLPSTSCCPRASCLSLASCTAQVHRVSPGGGEGGGGWAGGGWGAGLWKEHRPFFPLLALTAHAWRHAPVVIGCRWCASIHCPRPRVVGVQERIAKSPKLKMAITAGIGSDHVDLQAAMKRKIDVVEVTYCNSECVPCVYAPVCAPVCVPLCVCPCVCPCVCAPVCVPLCVCPCVYAPVRAVCASCQHALLAAVLPAPS